MTYPDDLASLSLSSSFNSSDNGSRSQTIITGYTPSLSRTERCIQGLDILPSDRVLTPVIEKKAYLPGWSKNFSILRSEISELLAKGKCTGYGLLTGEASNGKVAIDVDGSSAQPVLEKINQGFLPKTEEWTSGKIGRSQKLYQATDEQREVFKALNFTRESVIEHEGIKAVKGEAVEFRYNDHQSVLPPSKHPTEDEYKYINSPADTAIALLPDNIFKYLVERLTAKENTFKTVQLETREKIQNTATSDNDLVAFLMNEVYPKLELIQAFPGFELMGQSGHDLWGSPAYRKSESGKSFSITEKNGYPAFVDFKLGISGDCIQYRHILKGGNGKPTGKEWFDIAKEVTAEVGLELPKNDSKGFEKPKLKTETVNGVEKPIHPDQNPEYVYHTESGTDYKSPVPVDSKKLDIWVNSRTFTADRTIKNDKVDFELFPQKDNQISNIKAVKGGGKTEAAIKNIILRRINDGVHSIIIVPRRKLIEQVLTGLRILGENVANFSDLDKTSTIPENTHLVGCTESLEKLEGCCHKYDLYFDELTASVRQILSGGTVRNSDRAKLQEIIGNEIRAAKRVFVMDDDLADVDTEMLKAIAPKKEVVAIRFKTVKRLRVFSILDGISFDKNNEIDLKKANQSALLNLLIELGVKSFIVADTKATKIEKFLNQHGKVGFLINQDISKKERLPDGSHSKGETWKTLFERVPLAKERYGSLISDDKIYTSWVAEMMQDPSEFILKYQPDFIIGSPVIMTGFSVKLQKYFDCIAGIFCGLLRTQGLTQFLFRLRDNEIPTYISCPERGLITDNQQYYDEDLGKLINEQRTAAALAFDNPNIHDIVLNAQSRINPIWESRSFQEKALENFEKQHYRSCLRYALESEGHTVEFTTSITRPDITENLKAIAADEKIQYASEIFNAFEYADVDEAKEIDKKLETIDTARALTKARILDRVPGIKDTSIWSEDYILECYLKNRNFIKQQETFYFVHNPEISKKRLESALYNTATAEFVDGESLVHKDYHVIKALQALEIPDFIKQLENGLEISKKSPEVLKILAKARRKETKIYRLAGLIPDNKTVEQKENLKFIKQLLGLVGVFLKDNGQNNTKDGKYHVYGLDFEKFNAEYRTVTLDCINIRWNTWEAEKYQAEKPNWQYTKETGQRAPLNLSADELEFIGSSEPVTAVETVQEAVIVPDANVDAVMTDLIMSWNNTIEVGRIISGLDKNTKKAIWGQMETEAHREHYHKSIEHFKLSITKV